MPAIYLNEEVESIIAKTLDGMEFTREDARVLMDKVPVHSLEMSLLCGAADKLSRERFNNLGEVFVQIGINWAYCPIDCQFCVLATIPKDQAASEMARDEVMARARAAVDAGVNSVSLMITADYDFERFLEMGRAVREVLPADYPLVANAGDFTMSDARAMIEAGFTAVYHVIRLGEGIETKTNPEQRKRTLRAANAAGLDVSYCLEPIGPEHTVDELIDGIFVGKEFNPTSMATMRRIGVPGTHLARNGQITELEQAKIEAIATLAASSWPNLMMMSAHEPSMLFLRAGANRLTAEGGGNPRDTEEETSKSRAWSVKDCQKMLLESGFTLRRGASPAMQGPLRKN
ncbi:MAG: radical SAM protein [Armatimonadetes bacterium]|nr:radical SAM protein [Armatimonadota bacterium]